MEKQMCHECKRVTVLVSDHAAGDLVCSDCGLVLESHSVDETSDWRTFADGGGTTDSGRVGAAANPLLTGGGLFTVVARANGQEMRGGVRGWADRGQDPDRNLIDAFKAIGAMAERVGLVSTIKDRANETYKRVKDRRSTRGRSREAMLAACLYIACSLEGMPRTFEEIAAVANASKRDIMRNFKFIMKLLETDRVNPKLGNLTVVNAADLIHRFCGYLGTGRSAARAAAEVVKNMDSIDLRTSRAPT